MPDSYSLYEAKARLSQLVRLVREGRRFVITVHGKPVAELRPLQADEGGVAGRLARFEERGVVVPRAGETASLGPVARRRGALARFLAERD